MVITIDEPEKFVDAERIFCKLIDSLTLELQDSTLTETQRYEKSLYLRKVWIELQSMNRIRRLFRRRKLRGTPIC